MIMYLCNLVNSKTTKPCHLADHHWPLITDVWAAQCDHQIVSGKTDFGAHVEQS